jgi:hypothetical protein
LERPKQLCLPSALVTYDNPNLRIEKAQVTWHREKLKEEFLLVIGLVLR